MSTDRQQCEYTGAGLQCTKPKGHALPHSHDPIHLGQKFLLLPCPFCGCELEAQWNRPNPKAACRTEGCKGRQLPVLNLDVPEDIVSWNTRATPGALRTEIARARVDGFHDAIVELCGSHLHNRSRDVLMPEYYRRRDALSQGDPLSHDQGPSGVQL